MKIAYDPAKNEKNIRERGLSFDRARDFDFESARLEPIFRNGEDRVVATGYLDDRLHILCYKDVEGGRRIISFRKANEREAKLYGFELRR